MKKNAKLMLALLAGAMTVVSCGEDAFLDDENSSNIPTPVQGTMTFTATVGKEDETTRTSLKGLSIVWNQGDEISVFSSADFKTNNRMTLTAGAGTTSGSFSGDCEQGTDYYAFYPYSSGNAYNKKSVNVPIDIIGLEWNGLRQTAVAGSFDPRTPMMARTKGVEEGATTVPLQFKNILSFIKLTTDFPCRYITLTSNKESENLAATRLNLKDPNTGLLTIHTTTDSSPSVVLQGNDGADIAAGTYYIAVLPGSLSEGFKLTFSGINNTDLNLTKSTTKSVTLNRSEALNLGEIKLNDFKQDIFFGSGTEADPYRITSYDDWVLLVNTLNAQSTSSSYCSKYYLMTDDIDCTDKDPLIPIKNAFKGHFDGNNHAILNYRITALRKNNYSCYSGLFDDVRNAVIENMNCVLDDLVCSDSDDLESSVSPFINRATSSIINNIHLSGTKTLKLNFAPNYDCSIGCLIGTLMAKEDETTWIRNCSNALNIEISGDWYFESKDIIVGGIVGNAISTKYNGTLKIDRCRNTGSIAIYSANDLFAGGIIGRVYDGGDDVEFYLTNCVNVGNIIAGSEATESTWGDRAYAGGIVGKLDSDGEYVVPHIYNSLNQGKIEAYQTDEAWAGGIVGWAYSPITSAITDYDDPHLFNCANRGQTVGKSGAYPFVGNTGSNYDSKYAKCCVNDYSAPGEVHRPSIKESDMNENIGYAKIQLATGNNSKWVNYTWGCCQWTGAGSSLDIDFSKSVE